MCFSKDITFFLLEGTGQSLNEMVDALNVILVHKHNIYCIL